MKNIKILLLFPFIILLFSSCQYPIIKINEIDKTNVSKEIIVKDHVKVFLKDTSLVLFKNGFELKDEKLTGLGTRYYFNGKDSTGVQTFPIDSAIAITTLKSEIPPLRGFGSFLIGITSIPLTFLGVYCIACPKCCFGSCPTIYSSADDKEIKAELFSSSISKSLKANDLDRIGELKEGGKDFNIFVTNEALETHFIDKLKLTAVYHPKGSRVYNNSRGEFVLISGTKEDYNALNSKGESITSILSKDDGSSYRTFKKNEINTKPLDGYYDFVELKIKKDKNINNLKLLIKYRNTLLSTILFYDVVLASQGIKAIDWMNKMDNDEVYAKEFKKVYDLFSGIKLSYFKNGEWIKVTNLPDAGPLSWKYIAESIDVSDMKDEIKLRLEFFKDNIMIDYFGFDTHDTINDTYIKNLLPSEVSLNKEIITGQFINSVSFTDDNYLITEPGDKISLNYEILSKENEQATLFIESNGYYKEWIRGNWITNNNADYVFNLADIQGTINQLQHSWMENRDMVETEFFRTRIPLKGRMR